MPVPDPRTATIDIAHLRGWIGKTECRDYLVTAQRLREFRATLDLEPGEPAFGEAAPPLFHWCLATDAAPLSDLSADGHPWRGGFLPPVPLPRRMWAGGRLSFHDAIRVGDTLTRQSTVADVAVKEGKSGRLCFVKVEHRLSTGRGLAVAEEQDIVYRDAPPNPSLVLPAPPPQPVAPAESETTRTLDPSPPLLFRFSALTFNSHRIHYDRQYAMREEGYPGLVVHGPLQAVLLIGLAARLRPDDPVRGFSFRGVRPLFDLDPFTLCGQLKAEAAALRVIGNGGEVTMEAEASW